MQISRFPTLTIPLKTAIMAGALTISTTAAIFTAIANRNEILRSLDDRFEQIKDLYNNKIAPLFLSYYSSLSSLFKNYAEWFGYLSDNGEHIKEILNFSHIPNSYREMGKEIEGWYEELINFLKWLFWNLNESTIRSMVHKLSQSSGALLGMLTVLKNLLENLISGKMEKLPTDFSAFLKNTWNLFSENTEIIGELRDSDYNTIFNYMSDNPKEFSERIESLKNNAQKLNNPEGKWGNYKSKLEFLRDILPTDKSIKLLLERISNAYLNCNSPNISTPKDLCWKPYTSPADLQEFLKIKENIEMLEKLKGEGEYFVFNPPTPESRSE